MTTASQHRRSHAGPGRIAEVAHTSRPVSTTAVDTTSSANVSAVITTLAAGMCSQAKGQNTMAASGGYVNGRSHPDGRVEHHVASDAWYSGRPSIQARPPI